MMPGGLRLGRPAIMMAGFKAQDCTRVVDITERAVQIMVKLDN